MFFFGLLVSHTNGYALVGPLGMVLVPEICDEKEPFTWLMGLGIVLIVGGVLLIELGTSH
ncbi:hypothetical protein SAMN04489751_1388 [Brevibacterium sandarakinum]|uniref:Uncharacterized protein n=1 Tax=Brevibacterium sandarakinum TaxID=629680 RepID=A0A1H1Q092_BRESA|nr:hypothetical protein SAMN04489751_1388 [Brevibacterium sandarakinum]